MEILILIVIAIGIFTIATRSRRGHRGLTARKCPACRNLIHPKATVCEFCHSPVTPERWIWQRR
jgi:uncharacterized OB-fold protein